MQYIYESPHIKTPNELWGKETTRHSRTSCSIFNWEPEHGFIMWGHPVLPAVCISSTFHIYFLSLSERLLQICSRSAVSSWAKAPTSSWFQLTVVVSCSCLALCWRCTCKYSCVGLYLAFKLSNVDLMVALDEKSPVITTHLQENMSNFMAVFIW